MLKKSQQKIAGSFLAIIVLAVVIFFVINDGRGIKSMSWYQLLDAMGGIVFFLVLILGFLVFMKWLYLDAQARGVNGYLAILLVLASGLLMGIILWFIFRPKLLKDANNKFKSL